MALFYDEEDTFKSSAAKERVICISLFESAKLKAVNIIFTRNGSLLLHSSRWTSDPPSHTPERHKRQGGGADVGCW